MDLRIIQKAQVKKYDDSFLHLLSNEYQFTGTFPRYQISRNHCLCEFFRSEFDRSSLMHMLKMIAANPQSKKIMVLKYWGEPQIHPLTIKTEILEFANLLIANSLEENIWYEFMDKSQFH